jgi:hypothetical protein
MDIKGVSFTLVKGLCFVVSRVQFSEIFNLDFSLKLLKHIGNYVYYLF